MTKEKDAPELPERATQATTRPATAPLNELVLMPDLYCHREPEELQDRERLQPLMASLTVEGQQAPVEFYRGPDGKPVATKGHRRISAMRQLAKENTPGFSEAMPVEAVEVLNASRQDLLVRSVSDNTIRKSYTLAERIRAAKTLNDGGVEAGRAAFALDYSVKQYLRDLRIGQETWMLAYVEKDDVGHTAAGELLEAAEKADRVGELKDHLDKWTAARRREVEAGGKEKKLKGFLTKALADHWINRLRAKEPLDDHVPPPKDFEATINPESNLITMEGKVDLLQDPLSTLANFERTLQAMQKVVGRYRTARGAVEGPRGPQALARQEAWELEKLGQEPETGRDAPAPGQGEAPPGGVDGTTDGR